LDAASLKCLTILDVILPVHNYNVIFGLVVAAETVAMPVVATAVFFVKPLSFCGLPSITTLEAFANIVTN
jgi:hypothetical protein